MRAGRVIIVSILFVLALTLGSCEKKRDAQPNVTRITWLVPMQIENALAVLCGAVAATSAGLAIPVSLVGTVPALLASGICMVRNAISTEKDIGEAVRLEVETHHARTTAAPASQPS